LLAGGRLGLTLSVELKQFLPLGHHEETSCLLRSLPLARDLDGVLEVGIIDVLELFLLQPPEALRVEGGRDCRLLRITVELLLLTPLRHLLRCLNFCVCRSTRRMESPESSELKSRSSNSASSSDGVT
jgi:hypothetical protein